MVRVCIVCKRTDREILCHRFPKPVDRMQKWREALQVTDVDVVVLEKRFTVCTLHFAPRDYRNAESRMLTVSAVPTLETFDKTPFYTRPCDSAYANNTSLLDGNIVPYSSTEHTSGQLMELHFNASRRTDYLGENDKIEEIKYDSSSCSEQEADAESPMMNRTQEPKYANAFTQTEPVKFLSVEEIVQDKIIQEFYPDYVCRSKLSVIQELEELKKKLQSSTHE